MSIIGCHNCSYSAILNSLFLQIQLYDTFSLSLSFMCIVYCAIELKISFMVFIKQLQPRIFVQCKCCYTDWILPFKVRVLGSITLPGMAKITSFLFLHFFPSLHCAFSQGICVPVGRVLRVYGPSYRILRP